MVSQKVWSMKELCMASINTFRDLVVWQRSKELAVNVYRLTEGMPRSETFGLRDQMRRAAVSVPSNIAEGYARRTTPEYLRSLRIASGSLAELATQMEIALELKNMMLNEELRASAQSRIVEIEKMLFAIMRKLEARRKMQ
jgi:four helix bundle protein